jgi:hypothetical protein
MKIASKTVAGAIANGALPSNKLLIWVKEGTY